MLKKINKILIFIYCKRIKINDKVFFIKWLLKKFKKKIFLFLVFKNCIKKKLVNKYKKNKIIITGTGGDKKNTFNITSSIFIILYNIFKIKIIKYGSKSFTSKVGSIDFLNYFLKKNNIDLNILYSNDIFRNINYITKIRKKVCNKTIFNYTFPLINVSNSKYQIIGSSNLNFHKILKYKKNSNVMILSGLDNMDEASIYFPTKITIFKKNITSYIINYKTIKDKNEIFVKKVKESYLLFVNIFYNNVVKKIIFLNLYIVIKYLKKNKNIFFLLKRIFNIENFKNVKFFKRDCK